MTVAPSEASKVKRHQSERTNIDKADSCSQIATILDHHFRRAEKGVEVSVLCDAAVN